MDDGPLRILIAEDEPAHAEAIRRAFQTAGLNAEVLVVGTLQEYREISIANPPDIALLDLNLPDGRAVEVLTSSAESGPFPILIMTSFGNEEIAVEAMKAGALDYIVKSPEAFTRMPRIIEQALRQWTLLQERKQLEAALRESEERYRDLVEKSQDLICTQDLEGKLLSVNEAAVNLSGYSHEALLNMNLREFLAPEVREQFGAYLEEIRNKGQASGIMRVKTAAGETRYWEFNNTLRTEGVDIPIVRGMAHDVTERRLAELALRESEQRYRSHFENISDVILSYDREFRITSISPSLERTLGYRPEEFIGKSFAELNIFPPEYLEKAFSDAIRVFNGEHLDPIIYKLIARDRTIKYGEFSSTPMIREGQVVAVVSVGRDITERKRAEEKLRESEKRYRDLFDFLPIPVYEMDLETNITAANRAIYDTFRGTEEDLKKGIKAWQLLSPEEIEKSSKNIQRLLEGEQIEGTEYTLMRLDGTVFPAIVISSVIYSNDQPVGLRGAIVDITDRKQAEEKLRENEELFRSYLEHAPDGVYLSDLEGNFLYGNRKCEEIIGYRREELIGKGFLELNLLSENSLNKAVQLLQANTEGRPTGPDEIDLINKEGRFLPVEITTNVVQRMGQRIVLAFVRDITERKKAEEKLSQTLENLRKALGGIIQVISQTVETRDPYTTGHQQRVADLARAIGQEMKLDADRVDGLRMAGIIHDLGKISIPAEILSKPTKLNELEFQLIQTHPQVGHDILNDIDFPWPIATMVLQHHERMNGSGYPRGLKGEAILQEAKILMVADVVEAMASYRPYRPALGIAAALEEIEKNAGRLYDREVVEACLHLFREKGYKLE